MKTQILSVLVGLFAILLVSSVIALGGPQWSSPSTGGTITTDTAGSITKDKIVYKFEGTGKNGAPKGKAQTDSIPMPKECPRNGEALYSETQDLKDENGNIIAKLKLVFNKDCSLHSMTVSDKDGNNPAIYLPAR